MNPAVLEALITATAVAGMSLASLVAVLALPWSDSERAEVHLAVRTLPELPAMVRASWQGWRQRAPRELAESAGMIGEAVVARS